MPNQNVGALSNATGLVVKSKGRVANNKWGARERTITYYLPNAYYPLKDPTTFPPGDTARVDPEYDWLAAEESAWTKNGHAKGIGLLEVLYRGALFDSEEDDALTGAYRTGDSVKQTLVAPLIYNPGGSFPGMYLRGWATIQYLAREITYQYVSRSEPIAPRFLINPYPTDGSQPEPIIVKIEATTAILPVIPIDPDDITIIKGPYDPEVSVTTAHTVTGVTVVADTDVFHAAGHGLAAGDAIRLSAYTGSLPGGLTSQRLYYVIDDELTSDDFKLSTTLGGSALDITSDSTGALSFAAPSPIFLLINYTMTAAEVTPIPCGQFFETRETGRVEMRAISPPNGIIIGISPS